MSLCPSFTRPTYSFKLISPSSDFEVLRRNNSAILVRLVEFSWIHLNAEMLHRQMVFPIVRQLFVEHAYSSVVTSSDFLIHRGLFLLSCSHRGTTPSHSSFSLFSSFLSPRQPPRFWAHHPPLPSSFFFPLRLLPNQSLPSHTAPLRSRRIQKLLHQILQTTFLQ